jgi:acetolactate synthase-1/2/3 large subunit
MPPMNGARFIAETMHGYGVTHFFLMPVIIPESMPHLEELGIQRVMGHSEKGVAYMADGYGRVSGRPGVCGAQSVGAANMAAALQDAYLGCSPVVALTGRLPQVQQQRNAYQEVDHNDPFNATTKYNVMVNSADELPIFLRQAFREATSGTPGPAHLDLIGIAGGTLTADEVDLEVIVEDTFMEAPAFRPEPDVDSVRAAIAELAKAERPIIVAGGGVKVSGASAELMELAETLQIPVATALNAKETFPPDHPLAVGVPGSYSRECANRAVTEADLVFFIGSHTGGQVTNEWRIPGPGTRVVQLDINPAELGRSYPIAVGMQGDVKASLRKMLLNIDASPSESRSTWVGHVQQLVANWHESVEEVANSDAVPLRPERLCTDLANVLPGNSILVSDTGHSGIWTGTMIDFKSTEQSYIRCAGSLGWGIPAAIGAKAAASDRPVVCFTGDGGVWYHWTELETALRNNINTVTVINNNASLNQERGLNERIYGGPLPGSDHMWKLRETDFAAMAESMGLLGLTVTKPGELDSAMDQALSAKTPAVIDVKTDIEGIAPAAWMP